MGTFFLLLIFQCGRFWKQKHFLPFPPFLRIMKAGFGLPLKQSGWVGQQQLRLSCRTHRFNLKSVAGVFKLRGISVLAIAHNVARNVGRLAFRHCCAQCGRAGPGSWQVCDGGCSAQADFTRHCRVSKFGPRLASFFLIKAIMSMIYQ